MGIWEIIRDQFLDVIEFEDKSNKLIVAKFRRDSGNNELKQGSKVIVRESQCAVFMKEGWLADILFPGTYTLDTDNMPVLSTLEAFPFWFKSPVIAELYFVSTRQFIDNKWATKNPLIKRDKELGIVRIRAFGRFSFQIVDVSAFMREIFGTRGMMMTYDIAMYLSAMVTEAFSVTVGEAAMSILDLASGYRKFSSTILERLNISQNVTGIVFSDIIIENISLPDEVEKLIDEQSGIGMASRDMNAFMQYQTARAMRDAVEQDQGMAALSAGFAFGDKMARNIQGASISSEHANNKMEQLRELKQLLDEGILTQEEFNEEKKRILKM